MSNLLLNNPARAAGNEIYFAKVTRFYSISNTADVVTIDDNIAMMGCQILCSIPVSFSFGERSIPIVDDTAKETSYVMSPDDIYCVATFIQDYNQAVILGFLPPKETVLSIPDYGIHIFRHSSDVMWMIRGDGTVQVYHPSGSFIKIGSDDINEMSNESMIPSSVDSFYVRDAAQYIADKPTNLFIKWHAGQSITLNHAGDAIISTSGATITVSASGAVNLTANSTLNIDTASDIVVKSASKINLDTPALEIQGTPGVTGTHKHDSAVMIQTLHGLVTSIA